MKKGNNSEIVQNISLDENMSAPILEGQKLGEITYSINGETLDTVNLIASKKINRLTLLNISKLLLLKWFSMFRIE